MTYREHQNTYPSNKLPGSPTEIQFFGLNVKLVFVVDIVRNIVK